MCGLCQNSLLLYLTFVVVPSLSCILLFVTSWTAALQASLSFTISQSLLKLMSTELTRPSNHVILCCPLLLLPSIFQSIRVFSNESALCIRWPKYQSFSLSPSNEYSGLISVRIDCFDLLAVQGTLKSLFQHHSLKASVLRFSAFFIVQLSHLYMTMGKTMLYYAKSLQSCLTLCDPIDGSPRGSPVPGILQARTLEWVAISFSDA